MSLSQHKSYIFISEDMNIIKPLLQKSHQKYIAFVEALRIQLILFERINFRHFTFTHAQLFTTLSNMTGPHAIARVTVLDC